MSGEKTDFREVIAINRSKQLAMLADFVLIPVAHWLDIDGEYCDPDDAVVCVAGNEALGWWVVDLSDFEDKVLH